MESFGDNFVENEVDPAADFLAREQNELAGLEDELVASGPPVVLTNGTDLSGDLAAELEESEIDGEKTANDPVIDDGYREETVPSPPSVIRERREEPEKIKKWREEQMKSLEEKDELEEKKKEEWRLTAKKELEEWYEHQQQTITKTRANNRNNEKQLSVEEDEKIEPGTEWKRIAKLCDFNKKSTHNTKDASRMRSIILQLQQSPLKTKAV